MVNKILYWSIGIISVLFIAFAAYMIFIVKAGSVDTSKSNSIEVIGVVNDVYEDGVKDLVFKLKDDITVYYINRGLDNKFNLQSIQQELLGKEVSLWYAKHRSVGSKHLTRLQVKDSIYYTEWKAKISKNKASF